MRVRKAFSAREKDESPERKKISFGVFVCILKKEHVQMSLFFRRFTSISCMIRRKEKYSFPFGSYLQFLAVVDLAFADALLFEVCAFAELLFCVLDCDLAVERAQVPVLPFCVLLCVLFCVAILIFSFATGCVTILLWRTQK